jgi:lysozyme
MFELEIYKPYIKINEGLRLRLYKCSNEKWTIGWGRNLEDQGISRNEAEVLLNSDLTIAFRGLTTVFGYDVLKDLDHNRRLVLVDMMLNMGSPSFWDFKKMIQAVKDGWWDKAAYEILDSKYAREDVPNRADRNAKLMKKGGKICGRQKLTKYLPDTEACLSQEPDHSLCGFAVLVLLLILYCFLLLSGYLYSMAMILPCRLSIVVS